MDHMKSFLLNHLADYFPITEEGYDVEAFWYDPGKLGVEVVHSASEQRAEFSIFIEEM